MPRIYEKFYGIECRACGSTFACPDDTGPFCRPCMNKFRYEYYGNREVLNSPTKKDRNTHDEHDINRWLARQLELNLARLKKYGFTNKCECFTKQDQNQNAGYQCPRFATTIYNGRHVCKVHNRALLLEGKKQRESNFPSRNTNIGNSHHRKAGFIEEIKDPYDNLFEVLRDLSEYDEDFKQCLKKVIEAEPDPEQDESQNLTSL